MISLRFLLVLSSFPSSTAFHYFCKLKSSNQIIMSVDQERVPIIEALTKAGENIKAPFFFPGHKMGRGLPFLDFGTGPFAGIKGRNSRDPLWQYDLPEVPELDNLFAPEGPIKHAQELASDVFGPGVKKTWYLVNGSTGGVLAAMLAVVRYHQQRIQTSRGQSNEKKSKILLPRNVHKSAINALILAGAEPIFLRPLYDNDKDISHGISVRGQEGLQEILQRALSEDAECVAGVLLVSPTYHGAIMDVPEAARICQSFGVPLIVDEAHGAHLHFLSREQGALRAGADLVIQSTHKTLTALSQAAMLHASEHVDEVLEEMVTSALQIVQSSSPNYLLLASLDGARWQMGSPRGQGQAYLQKAVGLAELARERITKETSFDLLSSVSKDSNDGAFIGLDPLRLTVCGRNFNGFAADEVLIEDFGVYAEYPALRSLTFAIGPGNIEEDIGRLVEALVALSNKQEEEPLSATTASCTSLLPHSSSPRRLSTPRQAYFTASEVLSTDNDAILGRASAETVCPYPPGIPILLPGEIITIEVLQFLKKVLQAGGSVTGCSDPTLGKLRVLTLQRDSIN